MRTPLIVALATAVAVSPSAATATTGSLSGRVVPGTDALPAAKAVWVLPDGAGAPIPAPVATDGTFLVSNLPSGPADIAVETSEGLYVVDTPVAIAPGTMSEVQLALGGRQDNSDLPPSEKEKKKRKGGVWSNPVSATAIVVGSAVVLGVIVDSLTKSESNPPASPSSPD